MNTVVRTVAHAFAHTGRPVRQLGAWLAETPTYAALLTSSGRGVADSGALGETIQDEQLVYLNGCDGACPFRMAWEDDDRL